MKVEIEVDTLPGGERGNYLLTELARLYLGPNKQAVRLCFDRIEDKMVLVLYEQMKDDGSIHWIKRDPFTMMGLAAPLQIPEAPK